MSDVGDVLASIESLRARYVEFLRRRVGSDAEDLYQQCVVRAIERAGDLRDAAQAQAWFWRVLRNAVADHHSARVALDARHAAAAAFDEASSPETSAACACALGLMQKLPETYAVMLRRIDVDSERVADVARDLGITADAASVRLHRARKALRERLAGCCRVASMRACFACDCPDDMHRDD